MILSIIVPVYNVEGYIQRCIESIINQTNKNFELILVDDCGSDNSIKVAESILTNSGLDYQVFKRSENGGLSAARNSGMSIAKGDYFYFVDSDDELPLDCVEIILKTIMSNTTIDIFYLNADYWHTELKKFVHFLEPKSQEIISSEKFLHEFLIGRYLAYTWMYVFHRKNFETIQFPNGAVYEDALTLPYILRSTSQIYVDLSCSIYLYFVRQGSISRSFHPQLKNVIPAFQKMEEALFPPNDSLNADFVDFRTTYLMRLSRESFTRGANHEEIIALHKYWSKFVPSSNIAAMWKSGKKKSATFLRLLKINPRIIGLLYRFKILK